MNKLKYLKNLNIREFWISFIIGIFYFGYMFWWLWALNSLEYIGIQNKSAGLLLISIIFSLCTTVMGIFWGFFGFFSAKISKTNLNQPIMPLFLAGAFTLLEYLRSIFFSIFWYGGGGSMGPHWSIGNLAYLLINFDYLTVTASFWGIYGITFILVWFVAVSLLIFIQKKYRFKNTLQLLFIIALIISLNLVYQFINKSRTKSKLDPVQVAIIQTNIPSIGLNTQEEGLEDMRKKITLLEKAAKTIKEGIIVFPEGSKLTQALGQFLDAQGMKDYFNDLSTKELLIIDGLKNEDSYSKFTSNEVFISSKMGVIGIYGKQILFPLGEFLPYLIEIPAQILSPDFIERYSVSRKLTKGSGQNTINYQGLNIKILICSELISPTKAHSGNPDLIILAGSYALWKNDTIATKQILAALRFRAIENMKYAILAANSGQSYIINSEGNIEKTTTPHTYELLTGQIVPNKIRTWYNYVGDWPILLLSSVFFGLGLKKILDDKAS